MPASAVSNSRAGALTLNSAVAFWLDSTPDLTPDVARPGPRDGARASKPSRDYAIIFERNLFGSEPIPVALTGEPTPALDPNAELRPHRSAGR